MNGSDRTEKLDDDDHRVLPRLGYALARAQLFELALTKLLEIQRFDVNEPLDEHWDEVLGWMTKWPAGKLARELHLPEERFFNWPVIVAALLVIPQRAPLRTPARSPSSRRRPPS